jgi:hypothetical protein
MRVLALALVTLFSQASHAADIKVFPVTNMKNFFVVDVTGPFVADDGSGHPDRRNHPKRAISH